MHHGLAKDILDDRHRVLLAAHAAHPERFVNGPPRRVNLPNAVWINPPAKTTHQDAPRTTIMSADDPEVVPAGLIYKASSNDIVGPRHLVNNAQSLQ